MNLFLTIFLASRLWAFDPVCEEIAENYGQSGFLITSLPETCLQDVLDNALPAAHRTSEDGELMAVGYGPFLIFKSSEQEDWQLLTGKSSNLKNIIAVNFHREHSELVVLEEGGRVSFFWDFLPGNIAPFRVVFHPDLEGITDLFIHPKTKDLYLLHPEKKKIFVIDELYNVRGRPIERAVEIKRVYNSGPLADFKEGPPTLPLD